MFLKQQRWMLLESDASRNRTLLRWQRWMLWKSDVFRERLPHKRYYGSGMDALVTVLLRAYPGQRRMVTNHEKTLKRTEVARRSARARHQLMHRNLYRPLPFYVLLGPGMSTSVFTLNSHSDLNGA